GHAHRASRHVPAVPACGDGADLHDLGPYGVSVWQLPLCAGTGGRTAVRGGSATWAQRADRAAHPVPCREVDPVGRLSGPRRPALLAGLRPASPRPAVFGPGARAPGAATTSARAACGLPEGAGWGERPEPQLLATVYSKWTEFHCWRSLSGGRSRSL